MKLLCAFLLLSIVVLATAAPEDKDDAVVEGKYINYYCYCSVYQLEIKSYYCYYTLKLRGIYFWNCVNKYCPYHIKW